MTEDAEVVEEFVYGIDTWHDTAIFLPRAVAEEQARLAWVLKSATWGEVKGKASPALYVEVLGLAGFDGFGNYVAHLSIGTPVPGAIDEALRQYVETVGADLPEDDWPFNPGDISAYADGDWPPDPRSLMYEVLPPVAAELGEVYETVFNGTCVRFCWRSRNLAIDDHAISRSVINQLRG